jgi:hypothetical protein
VLLKLMKARRRARLISTPSCGKDAGKAIVCYLVATPEPAHVAWRPACRRGSPLPFPSLSLALRCMRRGEGESSDPSRSRCRCSWPLAATARDELGSRPRARTVVCGLINWLRFPAVETRTASAERKACCLRRGRRCAAASIVHRWPRQPAGACEDQIAHRRDCEKGHAL